MSKPIFRLSTTEYMNLSHLIQNIKIKSTRPMSNAQFPSGKSLGYFQRTRFLAFQRDLCQRRTRFLISHRNFQRFLTSDLPLGINRETSLELEVLKIKTSNYRHSFIIQEELLCQPSEEQPMQQQQQLRYKTSHFGLKCIYKRCINSWNLFTSGLNLIIASHSIVTVGQVSRTGTPCIRFNPFILTDQTNLHILSVV